VSRTLTNEEETLVQLGIQADRLLTDETFTSAINGLSETLANSIITTQLEQTDRRERLYMMHSCLLELIAILKARVAAKLNIEAMLNADDEEVN
jgi:hypothetical protein